MQHGVVALVFRCELLGPGGGSTTAEVDRIEWLTPAQLSRMKQAYRVRLLDSLDVAAPRVRAHDGVDLI
jgi:8-oxo-dGTP diphosphatase